MAGYTRNDTSNNIATGNVINAADLDGEFDALVAAFHASTGHTHDGTAANGAPITKIGPAQDLVISTGAITPKTDNTVDLGSSSFEFKDLYIDGTANIDALVADTADINAGTIDGVTLGTNSAVTEAQIDNININGNTISSTNTNGNINLVPNGTGDVILTADTIQIGDSNTDVTVTTNGTGDLIFNTNAGTNSGVIRIYDGANGNIALTPNGTGEVDISKVDIDGGAIDGTTIGGSTAAAGSFTTLTTSSTVTLNGGTANGVLYLDGSKVATSGSALTFDGGASFSFTGSGLYPVISVAPTGNNAIFGFRMDASAGNGRDWRIEQGRNAVGQFNITDITAGNTVRYSIGSDGTAIWNVGAGTGSEAMRLTSTGLGIGTSSPQSKLHIDVDGTALRISRGSSTGFLYNTGTASTDITRLQSDGGSVQLYTTGGTATLDSSGNLGIGTSSPSNKLQVNGSIVDNASGAYTAFTPTGLGVLAGGYGANNTANLWLAGGVGNNGNQVGHYINSVMSGNGGGGGSAALQIGQIAWSGSAFTSGTAQMTLDSSGNLGLGVTPSGSTIAQFEGGSNLLLVGRGNAYLSNNATFNSAFKYINTAAAGQYNISGGVHSWYTAPSGTAGNAITFTQAMTLDASGNLGVGTTSPTSVAGYKTIETQGSSGGIFQTSASGNTVKARFYSTSTAGYVGTNSNDPFAFITNDTERARITSGGALLVGGTSQTSGGEKFLVSGYAGVVSDAVAAGIYAGASGNKDLNFYSDGNSQFFTAARIRVNGDSYTDTGYMSFWTTSNNGSNVLTTAERARITSGGEVYIAGTTDQGAYNLQVNGTGVWGAGAYVNGSDERLKDNIQTLNDGLAVVSQLRPVTFQYKPEHSKDQSVQPGFIAQELQQAMDGKAYLDGVVQSGPEYLNVAYQNLIPILTKAIQEQQALITSLTARVALLEGN